VIEHAGRKDFQVKIRGLQVQTNEIEARLLDFPGVKSAIVAARDRMDGQKSLVAYLVVDADVFSGVGEIIRSLSSRLPRHMIPQHFHLMDALPKTFTGKVDRNALPLPSLSRIHVRAAFEEPVNDAEAEILAIWETAFGFSPIGVQDDFLELGGDSILSVRIINRVMDRFGLQITYAEMLDSRSVAEMAQAVAAGSRKPD